MDYGLDEIAFLWMDVRYGGWDFGFVVLLNIVLKKNAITFFDMRFVLKKNAISFLYLKKMRCIFTFSKMYFKICTFFGIDIPTIIKTMGMKKKRRKYERKVPYR
jgi:hypothetical protein